VRRPEELVRRSAEVNEDIRDLARRAVLEFLNNLWRLGTE
jgi:hypothetical protein